MGRLFLYSTNVFLKQLLQAKYRKDKHFVWCSESFDGTKLPGYTPGALIAPSSNPSDIYQDLKREVARNDYHSGKIGAQKASFKAQAVKWKIAGEITDSQEQDIIFMVDNAPSNHWRPLLYVIRRDLVETRMKLVPVSQAASFADEYIIDDLDRSEFDLIEL